METRTPEEEKLRLCSDQHLAPLIRQHRRFLGEMRHEPRSEEWLEAHVALLATWRLIYDDRSGLYALYNSYDAARFRWMGLEVREHANPRGEALQYVHHARGAHVILPMISMEEWSLLLDEFGSSDRFGKQPEPGGSNE